MLNQCLAKHACIATNNDLHSNIIAEKIIEYRYNLYMSLKNWFIKQHLKNMKDELNRLTIMERRKQFELTLGSITSPHEALTQDIEILPHLKARWIFDDHCRKEQVILYFHGGGFCMGTLDSYQATCTDIMHEVGIQVLLVDYRLAPEHPFPAGLYDCVAAYDFLLKEGYLPENIAFVGDSAGCNISLATALTLLKRHVRLPSCIVMLSPCTLVEMYDDDEIYHDIEKKDVFLSAHILRIWSKAYRNGISSKDPLVSPLYANLTGMPSLFITIGTDDMLLEPARLFHMRALDHGVDSTMEVKEGCFHAHQMLHAYIPEGIEVMKHVAQFIKKKLGIESRNRV